MTEAAKNAAIPSSAPLRANAYPKEGFSMVVDGKFKQHFATRDDAHQAAVSLKTKFPLLQVAVRDSVTAERVPVDLPEWLHKLRSRPLWRAAVRRYRENR